MKMNTSHIIIVVAVVILLSVALMSMSGGGSGSKKGKGKTIVTEMPQSGYSLDNDGFDNSGFPQSYPVTLAPPPEVDIPEPEMMGMDPTMPPEPTMAAMDEPEEFTQYAPRRFRGDIL
jgi:hypothetical protein